MSWWKSLWSGKPGLEASPVPEALHDLPFSLNGWMEKPARDGMRVWSGPDNSVMVADLIAESWSGLGEAEVRQKARALAEGAGGGLIEALALASPSGTAVQLIYKRLQQPAYVYTGMLIVPAEGGSVVWTVVDGEVRMTGIRESVVTSQLINAGKLSVESYKRDWAQDPYDKSYRGPDRRVLRFLSDDAQYDGQFPDHPLTKVRAVLAELAKSAQAVRQAGVSAAA